MNEGKKEKEEIFTYEVRILVCSPLVRNTLVQTTLKRTHLYGNLPYNINSSSSNSECICIDAIVTFRNFNSNINVFFNEQLKCAPETPPPPPKYVSTRVHT
jgi:hypothetical protein